MKRILFAALVLIILLFACCSARNLMAPKTPFIVLLNFNGYDPANKVWSENALPESYLTDSSKQVLIKRLDSLYSDFYILFTEDRAKFNAELPERRAQVTISGAPMIPMAGISLYNGIYLQDTTASFVNSDYFDYNPRMLAVVVAHELGHTLGLAHQSNWVGGTRIDVYNPGDATTSPIMGVSTLSQTPYWTTGTNMFGQLQDDRKILYELLGERPKRFRPKY